MLWPMQREWNKQYRDNVTKVVGWAVPHVRELHHCGACLHAPCLQPPNAPIKGTLLCLHAPAAMMLLPSHASCWIGLPT